MELRNKNIVVFGLGLHGGGVAAAKWCVSHGARVTIYDQKSEKALRTSIAQLRGMPITLQCGDNNPRAIRQADMVIKNPAVPRATPLLQEARRIESDLSLLLRHRRPKTIAVTGTKGKSSTVSAIDYALSSLGIAHATVGNIGVSIFEAMDVLGRIDILVLELSSFQLGDVRFIHIYNHQRGRNSDALPPPSYWPDIALCTSIYPDHLNYYATMEEYLKDKYAITADQHRGQWLILNGSGMRNTYCAEFISRSRAQVMLVGGEPQPFKADIAATMHITEKSNVATYDDGGEKRRYRLNTAALGAHTRHNLAMAYGALHCADVLKPKDDALFRAWGGVAHRMEIVGRGENICFVNDTAATIPEATQMAIRGIEVPIFLIAGGSDKNIHLARFVDIAAAVREIFLLDGSATVRISALLDRANKRYQGPFSSLDRAFESAIACIEDAHIEDIEDEERALHTTPSITQSAVLLLSPGCASFGMFRHEFERGEKYRALVHRYLKGAQST